MNVTYAVGDIHGRSDLLAQLLDHIRDHHALMHGGGEADIIFLGDYIDGGGDSLGVIDRLMRGVDGFRTFHLLGNHETLMLNCLETDDRQVWHTWLSNGGDTTLESLGVSLRFGGFDPDALRDALGPDRIEWLWRLSLYEVRDSYLFVHAGIVPGVPLEDQQPHDLVWIRSRFLDSEADHGHIVVHGHTPGDDPVVKPNRICIDTGATSNGNLTAAVLSDDPPLFLRASGAPGKGP